MIALRDASIRTKLLAGLGLAVSLVGLVGAAGLYNVQALDRSAGQIVAYWMPRIELLGEIKADMAEYGLLARWRLNETVLGPQVHLGDRIRSVSQKLERDWRLFEATPGDAEERLLYSVLHQVWGEYEAAIARTMPGIGSDEMALQHRDFEAANFAIFDHALQRIDGLIAYASRQSDAAGREVYGTFATAFWLTIGALALALCGIGVATAWVNRGISEPILRISEAMRRLAAGDASATVAGERGRKDEIGALIAAVDGYGASLIRARELSEAAEQERQRLSEAVKNMPIGLVMFDADKRLIIANSRYAEIYGLPPELAQPGTHLKTILDHRVDAGSYPGSDPSQYVEYLAGIVGGQKPFKDIIQFHDGRIVSLVYQPMEGGGWVSTHEDITDRHMAEAKIAHLTRHDALTDLPNRVLLRERIEDALLHAGRGGQIAVICLDIDHFKDVNDTLGHPIGDKLLVEAAKRLSGCIGENDTVARLGGDEFAIVQVGEVQPPAAHSLAQRLIEAVGEPYAIDGQEAIISLSAGIAVGPADGNDADQLLKAGDLALYRAKADGRGVYRFFEQEMDARMQARRTLELDLRRAIEMKQFELLYQPEFNLATNAVTGFEALLRWHHPERGVVAPLEFIPLAEETGLIVPIGEWVLRRACLDAVRWPAPVKVAVNLSAAQFRSVHLMPAVIGALAASGLAATRLELEITESTLLIESEATLTILHQLRALGVRVAMDDFGTGYSSLSYLQSFPFDKIKIDRRFITDVNTDASSLAIIRAVTGLSASLGIITTAEGVETREQFDRVKAEGCTEVQGFLTGRPMILDDAIALFQRPGSKVSAA